MNYRSLRWALLAAAFACAGSSFAADSLVDTKAVGNASAPSPKAKSKYASDPKQKVVDINGASKQELMKLPYVDEATADKIIEGRPFLSKAHLVSRKIIGAGPYQVIAKRIIARQESKPKK